MMEEFETSLRFFKKGSPYQRPIGYRIPEKEGEDAPISGFYFIKKRKYRS